MDDKCRKNRYKSNLSKRTSFTRERKNGVLIACSYAFTGLNMITAGGLALKASQNEMVVSRCVIMLGLLFLILILVIDDRKGSRGTFATVLNAIIHFASCIVLSILYSKWWLAVYVVEMTIYLLVNRYLKRKV